MAKKATASSGSEDSGSDQSSLQSAQQKQAMYLAQETGHFSLVKAMHLADAITLINGLSGCEHPFPPSRKQAVIAEANTSCYK